MNPLNWSGENRKAEKTPKVFTPNIYRKPVVADDEENEANSDISSGVPVNNVPTERPNPALGKQEPVYSIPASDIGYLLQKESLLSDIKKRYESEITEYEKKQKELDELKLRCTEQEKELNNKCAILKSAMERAEKTMPSEKAEELEKEIADFEQRRSELETGVNELETSRLNYEKEFAEYNSKMEELSCLRTAYETELEKYTQKKSELDEKCRSLEEKLSSGKEIPIEPGDPVYPVAIEVLRTAYYAELKELNRKRADIVTLRCELEDEETGLAEKRSSIEKIKEHIHTQLSDIGTKAEELETSIAHHEERVKAHKEKELAFQEEVRVLKERRVELEEEDEKLSLRREENARLEENINEFHTEMETRRKELEAEEEKLSLRREEYTRSEDGLERSFTEMEARREELEAEEEKLRSRREEYSRSQESLEIAFTEMQARREELEAEEEKLRSRCEDHTRSEEDLERAFAEMQARRRELEEEDQKLITRREHNARLEDDMGRCLAEMEAKRKELEEMIERTNTEIGSHVTLHRQNLDIKKLNNKLEQQAIYIQSLENSVAELRRSLEEARSDVKKNEVFSQILKHNLELMR